MLKLINGNPKEFADYIYRENSKICFWGVGVMLQICMHQIISEYGLFDRVICCLDSDLDKVGKKVLIGHNELPIENIDYLVQVASKDKRIIIVITCSYFYEILNKLDSIPELDNILCFVLPMIYLENPVFDERSMKKSNESKIPKKIHYCWFGKNQLPSQSVRCIESWKRFCPDYEIIRWDESNVDMNVSSWLVNAYVNKKWAFVSDYVRADVLYKYGGFYFDTDVELLKNLDDLVYLEAFGGFERWPVLNTGGGCGSIPGFWLWKEIMDLKDESMVGDENIVLPTASGYYDTFPLLKRGLKADGAMQKIEGFTIFPSEYFHPFDYVSKRINKTNNTYSIHHFNWLWVDKLMLDGNPKVKNYYLESRMRSVDINKL